MSEKKKKNTKKVTNKNNNKKKEVVSKTTAKKPKKKYFYRFVKRTFDIICSIIGLIFMIPVILIVKICYLCIGDTKSIFYTHNRIGKNGKIIKLIKFRSMIWNADEVLHNVLLKQKKYKDEWDKYQKLNDDPRITKVGKLLRKTSLDELPQFINVLKGDMSIIGPRPLIEGELDAHKGNHEIYESVRPGISGWWAANGRSATDYKKRLELEYYYCEHCSLWLDIKCIFKTIKVVLCRSGAK